MLYRSFRRERARLSVQRPPAFHQASTWSSRSAPRPTLNERRSSLVHHIAAQCAVLIIDGLVYISMAIRHRVLLSMFPSPVAVRFGSSQQLVWSSGFLPIGWVFVAGGREAAVAARRGSFVRRSVRGSKKVHTARMARDEGSTGGASSCTYYNRAGSTLGHRSPK